MLRAYYNLTKPGIIYGNLLTLVGGFFFGAAGSIDLSLFVSVILGTACVIGSACVANNYIDQEIDKKMERTKKRELVTKVISPQHALLYAFILGVIGFPVLGIFTNTYVLVCGAIAYLSYVAVYAYFKRKTYHGTLVGTIPGSMSLVAGYLAATNRLDVSAAMLFFIMVFWQMAHFYSIALFRKDDYQRANIPVFPIVKGNQLAKKHIFRWIVLFLGACICLSIFGLAGLSFAVVMLAVTLWWLQIVKRPAKNYASWGGAVFGRSLIVLLVMSATLSLNNFLP